MTRDDIQKDARDAYLATVTGWGILKIGTGVGKSKVAVDVIKALKPEKILILVNSEQLRDEGWKEQLDKFALPKKYRKQLMLECYQTAYKQEYDTDFDLVIADELDFGLTEEYSKVFERNRARFKRVLGMTATLDYKKHWRATELFGPSPVKFEYSTEDAQRDGILNQTRFVFVKYLLSQNPRSCSVGSGGRTFYFSENERYCFLEQRVEEAWQAYQLSRSLGTADMEAKENAWKYHARMRKDFLWSSLSSAWVARQLCWQILKENDSNKVLVFSKRTEQVEKICKYTFHGKNKRIDGSPNQAIDMLNRGDIRALGVCEAINRGINLSGVNHIIKESYDSSATTFQQQHGRGTRLSAGETMTMHIIVPCYTDATGKACYTQACHWAMEMSREFSLQGRSKQVFMNLNETKMTL